MGQFVTDLLVSVNVGAIWSAIEPAAPLVGTSILVAIGYLVLRRAIKGVGRGKASI